MVLDEDAWRRRTDAVAIACVIAVLIGWAFAAPELAVTSEDRAWEGYFTERGLAGTWCEPHGSYRPVCGSLLLLQAAWPYSLKLAASFAAHLVVVALTAGLAVRMAGRRALVVSAAVPLVWSTQSEVTLWLGGRCELTWVIPGLVGAHLVLTALRRDETRLSLLASVIVALAALGKEPGFLLPVAYLPMGTGLPRARVARHLAMTALLLPAALLLRTAVADGVGSYADHFISKGPIDWVGNLAYGVTKLVLGSVIHWPNAVAVVTPLAAASLLVWFIRRSTRLKAAVPTLVAIGALMLPTALVHAPRTLYGAVSYLAVVAGAAASRYPPVRIAACTLLVAHSISTVVSQRLWVDVTANRQAVVATVVRAAAENRRERVLLLGLRFRPFGIPAAVINRGDFDHLTVDGVLAARYAENELAPLRPARVLDVGVCHARFAFDPPPGPLFVPPHIGVRTSDREEVTIRVETNVLLVYCDAGARLRWLAIDCPQPAHNSNVIR